MKKVLVLLAYKAWTHIGGDYLGDPIEQPISPENTIGIISPSRSCSRKKWYHTYIQGSPLELDLIESPYASGGWWNAVIGSLFILYDQG